MYTYVCLSCDTEHEDIVKMEDRDKQFCKDCGNRLNRAVDRPGLVWAPTAGGMRT